MNQRRVAVSLYALLLLGASSSLAQTITGTITGQVTDPSGAYVPNVKVTATNTKTNLSNTAETNRAGIYNLLFLPVGEYQVTAEAAGFKKATFGPLTLEVNQTARVDITLQIGQLAESVDVTASATVLQTESATTGDTITSNTTTSIPLKGRNFAAVTLLVPGAITTAPTSFDSVGHNSSGGRPYVNGNREQTNNFLLDGADVNESIDNLIGYAPNIDALQEVKVITGNAGAEFGNANGAIVNMTLKSGTNEFHGNVFEYLQNDNLNANGFIANRQNQKRREFKRNIFGGTFGGPIRREKAFFFVDYQGARQSDSGQATASVAPLTWRTGNLSSITRQITDPLTNTPFSGNIIPSSRIVNPVARALFANPSLYPAPNNNGTGALGVIGNYIGSSANEVKNDQADAKVDYRFTENDNLSGRFSIRRVRQGPLAVALPTSIGTFTEAPTTGGVINWTRTISPTLVNEARVNINRVRIVDNPADVFGLFGAEGNSKLGIPGGQPVPGISELRITTSESLSNLGGVGLVNDSITNTFQYGDNLTWQKGSHLLKMGGQAIRYQQNRFYSGNNGALGFFTYNGFKTGSSFADFLLDQLQNKGRGSSSGKWGHRQWRTATFLQDDWKVSPSFTLNLGLRWEFNQPIYEVADRQLNVDIFTAQIRRAGQDGASRALYEPYYKQFMPRIGFAYSPEFFGKRNFVLRGGYGITSYLEGTGANLRLPLNPPNFVESDVPYSVGAPGTITTGFVGLIARDQLSGQIRAWDPNLRPAFIQQYNLSTEYQLRGDLSFTTAYVGQKGTHLIVPREGNQAVASTSSEINQRRPLYGVLPAVTQISYTESSSVMNYNSLQVTGRKRYAAGLEFIAAYTLSKTLTDNRGFYGAANGNVAGQGAYWQSTRVLDYGPAFFDARHNFTLGGTYELPFGSKRKYGADWNKGVDLLLGGWQLGYVVSMHSGFPITINSPDRSNAGGRTARANYYRPIKVVNQTIDNWFGTDPSARPCGPDQDNGVCAYGTQTLGQYGTAGVGTERAPDFRNLDLTLGKSFHITERQSVQFRAEFFNALNYVSFGAPDRTTNSSTFGFINSQFNSPRNIQFALKYIF